MVQSQYVTIFSSTHGSGYRVWTIMSATHLIMFMSDKLLVSAEHSKQKINFLSNCIYAVLWLVFMWSTYPWSPVEITHVFTTFITFIFHDSLWHHNGSWYCYGCLIVVSQWVITFLGSIIVMSQWIMTLLCVDNMASQWIMTLLWTSFAMYYYAKLWYCCFTSELLTIVHINH